MFRRMLRSENQAMLSVAGFEKDKLSGLCRKAQGIWTPVRARVFFFFASIFKIFISRQGRDFPHQESLRTLIF